MVEYLISNRNTPLFFIKKSKTILLKNAFSVLNWLIYDSNYINKISYIAFLRKYLALLYFPFFLLSPSFLYQTNIDREENTTMQFTKNLLKY